MKIILGLVTMANLVFAASPITVNQAYIMNRQSKIGSDSKAGTNLRDSLQKGTKATWSYAKQGGAASSDVTLQDMEGLPVKLPAGAIITDCLIDVVTQPTSATSSGSLAFSSASAGDLKAAAFVASYPVSRIACIPNGVVGNMIKLATETTLKMRIASEALTAGKVNIWVQYILSE